MGKILVTSLPQIITRAKTDGNRKYTRLEQWDSKLCAAGRVVSLLIMFLFSLIKIAGLQSVRRAAVCFRKSTDTCRGKRQTGF